MAIILLGDFHMFRGVKASIISIMLIGEIATAAEPPGRASNFSIEVEAGGAWLSRNDVRIPNDASGTRFALDDLTGSGPFPPPA